MHWLRTVLVLLVTPTGIALADNITDNVADTGAQTNAATQPNIVFILADDLGWRDVGYMGAAFFETPHIDRLAADGMRFTSAYSGGPNCAPTRACLMSGTYTPRHHIYTPGGQSKGNPQHMRLLVPAVGRAKNTDLRRLADSQFPISNSLDPAFVCLPEVLKPVGYTSARLGKWHLGNDVQGFDVSSANGKGGPGGSFYGQPDVTEQLTDRAIKFLSDQRAGPFFLYVPYWDVHTPLRGRDDLVAKYRRKRETLPATEQSRFNPVYAAMIEAVDTGVGRIVAQVDELGLADNTLIVFTSDNGGTVSSQLSPLRGMKGSLFEAGVRVPACMRWRGRIEPGSQCDTPITSVDFLPTFAALADAPLPDSQPVDGTDLTPLLDGGHIDERAIFWHYPLYLEGKGLTIALPDGTTQSWRGFPSTAMRRGDWKLIEFHEDNTIALYNLTEDPAETTNLAEQHPALARELRAELDDWQARTEAPIPSTPNPECILDAPSTLASAHDVPPSAAMGIMVGEVTATTALAQVRLTRVDHPNRGDVPGTAGVVEFTLMPTGTDTTGTGTAAPEGPRLRRAVTVAAEPARDFIARASFDGLTPGTTYRCTTRLAVDPQSLKGHSDVPGLAVPGPEATFQTLPGARQAADVRFVVVTGMNFAKFHGDDRIDRKQHAIENNTELPAAYTGPDKYLGYPALEAILELKPDFFVGTGDNVYYDTPDNPRAQTIPQLRQKWHEQFVQPRYVNLFAQVPTYWEIDDHDYRIDDGDNSGDYEPSPAVGRQLMLEQLPVAPAGDSDVKTYRTHRVSQDLQIWFTENRMYRSPNSLPDGQEKTIWGREQLDWLKATLQASDATFKLLISPTPMIGPDDLRKTDNHTNIGGFQHERDEFFQWLVDVGLAEQGFAIVCGDRHWQYRSIHPLGIEEYSCGALVDANSRPPRRPGDPNGTDPESLIRQPYAQDPPTGGFLLVHVAPGPSEPGRRNRAAGAGQPSLTLRWHDERGQVLSEHTRLGGTP